MDSLSGFVEKIKYRNEENGYAILSVESGGEDYVLVGTFPMISEGEYITAEGHFQLHPTYGEQLAVETYEIKTPEDSASVQRYLSSGAVKGVGEALAKRIVKKFKNDTLRILEEEPERLAEVKGISERLAMEIAGQIEEKRELRRAMLFLSGYGIRMNLAVKIYQRYGDEVYTLLRENPYRIADDLSGVGFQTADEIARRMGVRADSETRIRSGALYVLRLAVQEGHCYLPESVLRERLTKLLQLEPENLKELLAELQMEKRVVLRRTGEESGDCKVYLANYDRMELHVAAMLRELDLREARPGIRAAEELALLEEEAAGPGRRGGAPPSWLEPEGCPRDRTALQREQPCRRHDGQDPRDHNPQHQEDHRGGTGDSLLKCRATNGRRAGQQRALAACAGNQRELQHLRGAECRGGKPRGDLPAA